MKKSVFAGLLLGVLLLGSSCGAGVQAEQRQSEIEVGSKNIIWRDMISLEDAGDFKISCDTDEVDLEELGEYSVTYRFENKKNKRKSTKEFTFQVVDTTAPRLTLSKKNVEVITGKEFDPLDYVTVKDNYDALTVKDIVVDSAVDTSVLGEYKVTYTVKDQSGNEVRETMTVTVIEEMTAKRMDELLKQQPIYVESTKYVVQDTRFKSLYPDMLRAVLKNESGKSIKNAVVAFVAWDKNDLPIKIKGDSDFSDGAYIREVDYDDINLVDGTVYGRNSGYEIDENLGIKTFKAMVVSYEDFSGEYWDNPLYDAWIELYEGKQYIW